MEPQIGPNCFRHPVKALVDAVKEIVMVQTRGVCRAVIQTSLNSHAVQATFNQDFAAKIGSKLYRSSELSKALEDMAPLLLRPPPLHFEDDSGGTGLCAVCQLRGTMTTCGKCGLLVHMSRAPPTLLGRDIVCPRCRATDNEDIKGYDIRSKLYSRPAPSASDRAQAGSTASSSGDPVHAAVPFNGATAGEQSPPFGKRKR